MSEERVQTILLVRHGATGPAWHGRYVGRLDPPLAGDGPRQARRVAERLVGLPAGWRPEICLTSPLVRCRQTAAAVVEAVGCPLVVEPELREIDFGRWEGRTFGEIEAAEPQFVRRWTAAPEAFRFPEGESVAAFNDRVRRALDRIRARPEERLVVVAHGGVIRVMLCLLLGIDIRCGFAFAVEPACLVVVLCSRGWGRLVALEQPDWA